MSLVAINLTPLWPEPGHSGAAPASLLLDANDEKAGFVLQAPKAGDIDRILFRTNTVTTGDTMDVRLETVGADGFPSGTLWATNTNGSQIILATEDNTWFEVTLTAAATVARGNMFAIVISLPSVAVGNLNIAKGGANQAWQRGFPSAAHYVAGAWSNGTGGGGPVCAVRYSDGSYPNLGMALSAAVSVTAFNSGSTPDERGNKITVPFDCKVAGCYYMKDGNTAGDATFKLYDNSGSLAASKALDGDMLDVAGNGGIGYVLFDTEVTLNAGDVVRVTVLPTTATNTQIGTITAPTSSQVLALPGGGSVVQTTRTDAGSWTDTVGAETTIGLLLSAVDDGAGGGASAYAYGFAS